MVRIAGFHPVGRGSIPRGETALIAQLVEHGAYDAAAQGSNPCKSTQVKSKLFKMQKHE